MRVYKRGVPGGGQCGGYSRIFRHAQDDHRLVAFACEARMLWREGVRGQVPARLARLHDGSGEFGAAGGDARGLTGE